MTSMTVGKDRIDLLQDELDALKKEVAELKKAGDVQDNIGWVYGVPMYSPSFFPDASAISAKSLEGLVNLVPPAQSRTETA